MRNGFYTEVTISVKEMNKANGLHSSSTTTINDAVTVDGILECFKNILRSKKILDNREYLVFVKKNNE